MLVPALASAKKLDPLDMPLPELELIPGASSQWVGRQMAHNGMPMSIRMFSYPGEERDVAKFYRNLFKAKGHGESKERNLGEYRVIGYELRGYIYSVQYRQVGPNVEGKLTVSPVPGRYRHSTSSQLPIPPGCHVLNKVESLDFGKRSETLTVNCEKRLGEVEYFYSTALENDGWLRVTNRKGDLGSVMDYQRGSETLQVTVKQFTKKNKRLVNILINWVK
ncbi:MAG: hypothetical protein R3208_07065 [Ketobacteraceae bacterium]|nr:hypothetical protein [Ketobacteraceae bacterium]